MQLTKLIEKAIESKASDLHLIAGLPPAMRVIDEIIFMDYNVLSAEQISDIILSLLTDDQKTKLKEELKLSFSILLPNFAHIRISVYYRLGELEASIRIRELDIKSIDKLGLPLSVAEWIRKPYGLILITGSTGVGKTTTFYSMIDQINRERRVRIITVEDPIEYVHKHNRSIIIQQELNADVKSFSDAITHILRLDPDVIGIGEMRDKDTISAALTAADTGHLVLATLHTGDATQTVDRILNIFQPNEQAQITIQLAGCLIAVITQTLLPSIDKKRLVLAYEILVANDAVRNIVRENKIQTLYSIIQSSKEFGMQTMDMSLRDLYQKGIISYDVAASKVRDIKFLLDKK